METTKMTVKASPPVMVFVAGIRLHPECFSIQASAVDPTSCALTIFNSPKLPKGIREMIVFSSPPNTVADPELWFSVVLPIMSSNTSAPVQIEMQLRDVKWEAEGRPSKQEA